MPTLSLIANLFDVPFFNPDSLLDLIFNFFFNLGIAVFIVRFIYFRKTRRKDYLFTYLLINTLVFLLCILLSGVELKLGFAFGLFALFGILRYRTNPVPIKEMTYLFVLIGISVINSLSGNEVPFSEVLFSNIAIIIILWLLEYAFLLSHESSKRITYEKISLIQPEKKDELLDDLRKRTGINIHRIEIKSINFLRDTARIDIFFYDRNLITNVDNDTAPDDSDD
jgi:hypothetical protein